MIRILVFLTIIAVLAAAITGLASVEGFAVIRFGDTNITARSSVLFGAALIGAVLLICATLILSGIVRLPSSIRRQRAERRRERGLIALTRGLEAVAAGDASDAQRLARTAQKQLGQQGNEAGLSRLLTAQAAQLAGDEETAQQSFAAMLQAPETEFLGLRGLYLQAMASGDRKEARQYAERAFKLRPGASWAFQSVYALQLERGAWGEARDALLKAQQHGLEKGEPSRRREAALLTAMAYGAEAAEDTDTAIKEAEEALRKAPGFAPAAVLAAELETKAGRRSRAGKLLDEAWAISPHPALAKTMDEIYAKEKLERRTDRLIALANKRPEADESQLLIAEQENRLGKFTEAKARLEPLLTRNPRARTFSAMAAAVRGLYGSEAAQIWLDRAANAPLDPVPGADGSFVFTTDGWQRLIREFGDHGRLAPPPLDVIRTSLTLEEVKLLSAPASLDTVQEVAADETATSAPSTPATGEGLMDQLSKDKGLAPEGQPEEPSNDKPGQRKTDDPAKA
ncbi:hypothetical protein PB2503_03027 [Parvularcula bermudensis HTCC2503]|uniref:HemY N-terminal domain-containing protein n=1 Tax=Parvularcula bermudensis (strain ATCC BAA-594 / HTCC2503 / KCTC 12087) TaxID=314260 RepID=E0TD23_PARBH|nr:heme biosynthesis HemY N-terminal domain-containing protein [Parvularcula bermudensis]ADM08682.1 hypothetical protein PB2503_03027 [Parvularcula bermudensis HTCC2503]